MTPSRSAGRVALVALVSVVLVLTGLSAASADPDAGAESDFVGRVNAARSGRGLGTLTVDGELTAIARRWSQRMADDNRLAHNPNLSKEVTQDWEKLAENVGFGGDVAAIHEAFMNSSAHRANILDPALTHIGVGVVADGSGQLWVTEVFMRLRGGASGGSPAPGPAPTAAPAPTTTARPRGPRRPPRRRPAGADRGPADHRTRGDGAAPPDTRARAGSRAGPRRRRRNRRPRRSR